MAQNQSIVYLGYLDEAISTKHLQSVDYRSNKVGGEADFPFPGIQIANCPICGLKRPLLVQIYAPLDNSAFHRTLFVFCCLNPGCSIQSRAWICIRSQVLDNYEQSNESVKNKHRGGEKNVLNLNDWCSGADDWGTSDVNLDNEKFQKLPPSSADEENGNMIEDPESGRNLSDDESNSAELVADLNMLQIDEENANCGGIQTGFDGAVGPMLTSFRNQATAEIEGGDETEELVTIDTPISPQRDLIALLKQTSALKVDQNQGLTLNSYFIYVDEEETGHISQRGNKISEHVQDLLLDYQRKDESLTKSPDSPCVKETMNSATVDVEMYEKSIPAHGDVLFHAFLMRIQENPGQILRYSRNSNPLLIAPMKETISFCQNCGGELICELQILPTVIPMLRLAHNGEQVPIEFGNVLIYTCAKSCWDTPDKSRLEVCVVQREL